MGYAGFLLALEFVRVVGVAEAQLTGRESDHGVGGWVIPLATHASPGMAGESLTEGYLTQPVLHGHVSSAGDRLRAGGMLNLEGLTLKRGELNAGIWGEGYVDRRHPHTYLHEFTIQGWVLGTPSSSEAISVTLGRGFAPFGTDDPMARPLVKFPANHHLSHVMERYVAVGAIRFIRASVELGLFNGNEPSAVDDLRGLDRVADSWASRVTVWPVDGFELQSSFARVDSPELPRSAASVHRKWSASGRFERSISESRGMYALLEWARTEDHLGDAKANDFQTALVEAALRRAGVEGSMRYERTSRPEEERLVDPFRSPRPHSDAHILGITDWRIVSARLQYPGLTRNGRYAARPFLEVSRAKVEKRNPTQAFDPGEVYGSTALWNLSLGVRLEAGAVHGRMGRYGAAMPTSATRHQH